MSGLAGTAAIEFAFADTLLRVSLQIASVKKLASSGYYSRSKESCSLRVLKRYAQAYRVPDSAAIFYAAARDALLQVIQSGKYELNPSFTTLWDPGAVWTKEAIWEEVLDQGSQWNSWANLTDAHDWTTYFTACPANGGWGTLYLSWEWWSSYEQDGPEWDYYHKKRWRRGSASSGEGQAERFYAEPGRRQISSFPFFKRLKIVQRYQRVNLLI